MVLTTPLGRRPPVRDTFVAWPPAGFVPYQVVLPALVVQPAQRGLLQATVTMQHNGASLPLTVACVDPNVTNNPSCGQFGEPAISWIPTVAFGATWPQPAADDPYTVTVSGYSVNGVAAAADHVHHDGDRSGGVGAPRHLGGADWSGQPRAGQGATYSVTPAADASGYQWRTTPLTPGDAVDGAENGLGNWIGRCGAAGPPRSRRWRRRRDVVVPSGERVRGRSAPQPQTLTWKNTIVPSATGSVSFDSLYFSILERDRRGAGVASTAASAWQQVFGESPPWAQQDTAFTHRTVSLAAYAGQPIQVRLALTFNGGNWADCCNEPGGWYFDNVALANVQNAGTPTLSAVTRSRRSC